MTTRSRFGLIVVLIGLIAGFASGVSVVGRPARLVDVLTLFASGAAGGAGLTAALWRRRP